MSITIYEGPDRLASFMNEMNRQTEEALQSVMEELERLRAAERKRAEYENEPLNLQRAAEESGYSPDRLGELVREGVIPNAARKYATKIRRKDLPRKPGVGLTPAPLRLHAPHARSAPLHEGEER